MFKKPRKVLGVKNGVMTVVATLNGTLEELQDRNPVKQEEGESSAQIQFSPDSYYPNTDQASTIRAFLKNKGSPLEHTKVTNIQLTRFVNNFPVPIGVFLSGVEDQPSQQLSILGYDELVEQIQTAFNVSFSPSTEVITTNASNPKASSLSLKHSKPKASFLPKDSEEGGLVSPVATDLYAYSNGFSTSAGLSTHMGGIGDQQTYKSNKDDETTRPGSASSKSSELNTKKFSINQLNKSAITIENDNVLSTATPWGSPLHINALNGAVWNTLKKHSDVLKQQLKISDEKINAALAAAKAIWESNVDRTSESSPWGFAQQRDTSKKTTTLDNIANPSYATYTAPQDNSEALFTKDTFVTFVELVRASESGWHQEDESLFDVDTWRSTESSDKWWEVLKNDGVWKNALREWVFQEDRVEAARVAIVPRDMVTMYLACLMHERVKSGDMDTRRFTIMFSRLDSPQDWSAQGTMSESQFQSVQGKRFSAEVRLNVHYAILSPEPESGPVASSSFFDVDNYDEEEDLGDIYGGSDDDYDSEGY